MTRYWKFSALLLPLLLTGCQDGASDLASISDGSTPVASFDALIAGLAVEDSPETLGCSDVLARFDADGDGQLSDAEKETAKEAMRAEFLERFDTDGDGSLSETERDAARAERRAGFVARFDTDGDGAISALERQEIS